VSGVVEAAAAVAAALHRWRPERHKVFDAQDLRRRPPSSPSLDDEDDDEVDDEDDVEANVVSDDSDVAETEKWKFIVVFIALKVLFFLFN